MSCVISVCASTEHRVRLEEELTNVSSQSLLPGVFGLGYAPDCIVSVEVRHSALGYNDGFGEGRRGNQGTQVPPPAPPPSFFPLRGEEGQAKGGRRALWPGGP